MKFKVDANKELLLQTAEVLNIKDVFAQVIKTYNGTTSSPVFVVDAEDEDVRNFHNVLNNATGRMYNISVVKCERPVGLKYPYVLIHNGEWVR